MVREFHLDRNRDSIKVYDATLQCPAYIGLGKVVSPGTTMKFGTSSNEWFNDQWLFVTEKNVQDKVEVFRLGRDPILYANIAWIEYGSYSVLNWYEDMWTDE